jgi:dihydrofolate reductase
MQGRAKEDSMRKVVVSEFVSLDGVMEAPDKWHFPFFNEEAGKYKFDELFASDALLLGRVTYEGFAAAWPSRSNGEGFTDSSTMDDEKAFADMMNSLPKYVFSTTLEEPLEWNNSTLIEGNVAEEVSRLKQQSGKDILVFGSTELVNTLMQHDLIDEYRLMVFPVVVGSGKRLFRDGSDTKALRLVDAKPLSSGVVVLTYQPRGKEVEGA